MLEEAVAAMKGGDLGEAADKWSPEIALGMPVLIPEAYVTDLQLRLGLYRRLSSLENRADIDGFAAELVDRFGELPDEVRYLLDVMEIKGLCRAANIAKVDAGPKGAVVTFRKNDFPNAAGLAQFLQAERARAKMQPDHKLVFRGDYDTASDRIKGVRQLVASLARIAGEAKKAA
jgi:transcription-repair coupling factor (superfamily II helicase)